jgi:hypothetical protein
MDGHEIFDEHRRIASELAELIDAVIVPALMGRIVVSARTQPPRHVRVPATLLWGCGEG